MKKFLIIILVLAIVGCVSVNPAKKSEVATQRLEIKITGDQPVKVQEKGDGISRGMEVQNTEIKLSGMTVIANNKVFMKIVGGLSTHDVTSFWNDVVYLENKTKIKNIDLFINSGGGSAFAGLALVDEIERAKKRGFNITAYASGIIASATVPILAVCNTRIAAPGTIFMVHQPSLFKFFSNESASDIRAQNELMNILRNRYIGKLVETTKLSEDEWIAMEIRTTWFDAQKAQEIGLIDKIE